MNQESFDNAKTSVTKDADQVAAETKSFAAFDDWMDEQLELLVARWIHTAAPNASRVRRLRNTVR